MGFEVVAFFLHDFVGMSVDDSRDLVLVSVLAGLDDVVRLFVVLPRRRGERIVVLDKIPILLHFYFFFRV